MESAVAETIARYGKLDILHNNAGGSTLEDGPVTEAPEEEFWRAIKLDLFGTFLCSKIAIPHIIKAGGGSVINMASNFGLDGGAWTGLLHGGQGRRCLHDTFHGRRVCTAQDQGECDCSIGDAHRTCQAPPRRQ